MNQVDDRKKCDLCNRKFASDRFAKHIEICKKQKEKKRGVFDSYKQRQILDQSEENGEQIQPKSNKPKAKIVKPVTRPPVKSTAVAAKKPTTKSTNIVEKNNAQNLENNKAISKATSKATNSIVANGTTANGTNGIDSSKNTTSLASNGSDTNSDNIKKSKWRESHEEFIRSIQSAKKVNGSLDSNDVDQQTHKSNGIESADKESTITTNSDQTNRTNSTTSTSHTKDLTASSSNTLNTNEKSSDKENSQLNGEKPKPAPRKKIQPPQSRLNKASKTNNQGEQQSNKQANGQMMMNGSTTTLNLTNNTASGRKSMNTACVECPFCGRTFNRAAGERHIPWCSEQQQRKNSSNVTNEEALARFRARNAYRSNVKGLKKKERDKSVPNEKKYVRQSSLRRALSTIDGLDQAFNNKEQSNSISNLNKRSTSHGNLNRTTRYKDSHQPAKKLQISTLSKTSSASSKGSAHHLYNNSAGFREQAQSRVKARLNQQQKLQKQRMNSNYPKTPIMKFKDKFPNHHNKLIEFADSQQFSQMFKKHLNNSIELNNLPKTVPGVRTGGLSPTKEIHNRNGHDDLNDLDQLRARIKEMYLSSNNGNHSQNDLLDYHLTSNNDFNETSFTRENSSSKIKSSKSVNDFLTLNDGFNDLISDLEPKTCYQCKADYISTNAMPQFYCYHCGTRLPRY